jgi:peptidoglycan biosynthesis protein MviN/MurJ (putative lipid II flippase)
VAAWTLVSRVTGLGRAIVIGAVLGPTFFANTFVATNTIPNVAYLAIAGTVLSAVVVPAIVRTMNATGTLSVADLLGRLAGFLLLLTGAATVLLLLVSPLIARLLTFGIADAATRSRAEDLTVVMVLFVAPQVMLYMIAFLGAAAQQARGRFALAAAAPAVENVGVMATVAAVGLMYGPSVETDDAALGLPILLCVGSTLSVALHMALQLVGAARVGLPIRPRLQRRPDPVTLEVTRRIRRSFVVAASPDTAYFTLLALAATVPGGVLVLQMAYAVYSLPVALGGRAVRTAVLPGLSDAADRSDRSVFADKAREGIAYAFIAGLPPLFLLAVFASPIADLLANGELRVGDLIQALAGCLVVLAVAQLAAGLHEVGREALFARLDVRGPRIAALLALGVTLTGGLLTLLGLAGTDRLIGLSAAVLAGDVVAASTVILLLRRVVRPHALADRRRLRAAAMASTVMLPLIAGGWLLVDGLQGNRIGNLLIIGMTSTLALGLFGLTLHAATRHPGVAA